MLVDALVGLGYTNLTVLDISSKSIERAKIRLGDKADKVNWIISDMLLMSTKTKYDLWHDRAAFRFLINESKQNTYVDIVHQYLQSNGFLVYLSSLFKYWVKPSSSSQLPSYFFPLIKKDGVPFTPLLTPLSKSLSTLFETTLF